MKRTSKCPSCKKEYTFHSVNAGVCWDCLQKERMKSWEKYELEVKEAIGEPDDDYGYTVSLLQEKLGDKYEKFAEFNRGSTGMINKQGQFVVYMQDIANYLYAVKNGKALFFD